MKVTDFGSGVFQSAFTNRYDKDEKAALAKQLGLQAVVCLCPRSDADWADLGLRYVHRHVPDSMAYGLRIDQYLGLELLAVLTSGPTLSYCYGGKNRSVLFAALLLRQRNACTGAQALAAVLAKKPTALSNPHFRAYLNDLRGNQI